MALEMKAPAGHEADGGSKRSSVRAWSRGSSSFRIAPSSVIHSSRSQASSHYCDIDLLDLDLEEDDHLFPEALEEGNTEPEVSYSVSPAAAAEKEKKKQQESRLSVILLDQGLFTVYKRLFFICITLNIGALVVAATGHFPYARNRAALFSIANIFVLTLCRSEAFLRVVFWAAVKVLGHSWVPLFAKTAATSFLQSLGGIHSGCGVSSIAWLIYALYHTSSSSPSSPEIIAVASIILALICLSSLAAFPLVRHLHHNVFERTHRFAGWTALILLWVFVLLTISYDPQTKSYSSKDVKSRVVKQPEFWLTMGITILIIIPWITTRRVAVKISSQSGHASLIKFQGGVKPGILGRISPSPLSEWHAFGIISDGKTEHMMLAGAVGDFTKSLVSKPPSHLWVRGIHFAGLPYLVNMYNRVLLVATGSGICVFMSFLLQPCAAEVCMLWVTKGVDHNYGQEIKEMIMIEKKQAAAKEKKKKVIVHDTDVYGRPNVSEMTVEAARKWEAQVVIITSNPKASKDVIDACTSAGIPAFGPIWDS